ncbi:hypothetical protein BpHYR1_012657, partial [Brachionus plicatilis]
LCLYKKQIKWFSICRSNFYNFISFLYPELSFNEQNKTKSNTYVFLFNVLDQINELIFNISIKRSDKNSSAVFYKWIVDTISSAESSLKNKN